MPSCGFLSSLKSKYSQAADTFLIEISITDVFTFFKRFSNLLRINLVYVFFLRCVCFVSQDVFLPESLRRASPLPHLSGFPLVIPSARGRYEIYHLEAIPKELYHFWFLFAIVLQEIIHLLFVLDLGTEKSYLVSQSTKDLPQQSCNSASSFAFEYSILTSSLESSMTSVAYSS